MRMQSLATAGHERQLGRPHASRAPRGLTAETEDGGLRGIEWTRGILVVVGWM